MSVKVLLAVCCLALALTASAHRVRVFAALEGGVVKGNVYFSKGAKAVNVKVEVQDAAGKKLADLETNGNGEFEYKPVSAGALKFLVNTGDGHVCDYTLGAAAAPAALDDSPAPTGDFKALGRQLHALQRQLDDYEAQTRLRDVVGGIGYIVGMAGLCAFFLARRKKGG